MTRARRATITWSSAAARDFDQIHEFIARGGRRRARVFVSGVQAATERLEFDPEVGPVAEDLDSAGSYRSLPCPPHRIIYRYADGVVLVLRLWDNRRYPADFSVPGAPPGEETE